MTKKPTGMLAAMIPLLAFCGLCAATSSCSTRGGSDSQTTELTTDSISCSDSLISRGARAYCSITADYPQGKTALADSVRLWIADRLSYIGYTGPSDTIPYVTPGSNLSDGKAMIRNVCSTVLADAGKEFEALDSIHAINPEFGLQYEYYCDIKKICQTETFVTYTANSYAFLGGAHGNSFSIGQTFDAATGGLIGNNMIRTEAVAKVISLIKDDLMKYFEVSTPEELRDIMLVKPEELTLPSTPLTLMDDGVHFLYQQYEIAPYVAGMPNGVIPYSKLTGCLTPAVEALIPAQAE